ncbi:MAG: hypothetical protein M1308_05025 [Actinobacteria bacterium]|nr:hypothetical protein [Actinomycetota bacterium]
MDNNEYTLIIEAGKKYMYNVVKKSLIKFDNKLFSINSKIHKKLISRSMKPRPSSYPYISGDSFRAIANHIFESKTEKFDAQGVKYGDIVFVSTYLIMDFFKNIHPFIANKYILITHNSDTAYSRILIKIHASL